MKVGYYRCSSDEQNPSRQKKILKESGCEKVFSDMLSGKDRNRPGLDQMLSFVREGDTVYVESISRLARSTKDLLNIVDELKDKGVTFVSQKETIDTDTPQGKFMLTVFAAMADLERSQIRQRQAEGQGQGVRLQAEGRTARRMAPRDRADCGRSRRRPADG